MASMVDAGNVFGADPHKRTVTATVLDERGGALGTATFRVSGDGHPAMEEWALKFGPITRWGIEGASGLGRPLRCSSSGRATTCALCADAHC
jgi:transposase